MSRKMRSAVVAFALANLLVSAAFAQARPSRPAPARGTGVWEWVVGLFAPVASAAKAPGTGIVAKEGSQMDPDGARTFGTTSSFSTTDAGSHMDPNGIK